MSSPEDRAVLLLQRTSELMLECRAVARELQEPASGTESPQDAWTYPSHTRSGGTSRRTQASGASTT
jgi:hypothetical protein